MADSIRIEEFTGIIQNKIVSVWQSPDAVTAWIPTEFLLTQYITRILIAGRTSPISTELTADPTWTQIWRNPGGKEWSCLFGILQYMPGPVLIVVSPDMALSPKIVSGLSAIKPYATILLLRQGGSSIQESDQVFFPIMDTAGRHGVSHIAQEYVAKSVPRNLDIRGLVPQLLGQGYALTVADGVWHWYKPADSTPMAVLSIPQIARQLQILGSVLERSV